jgi:hypothetical protein
VVELALSHTSRIVVSMAAAVARNQRRICPESTRKRIAFLSGIIIALRGL